MVLVLRSVVEGERTAGGTANHMSRSEMQAVEAQLFSSSFSWAALLSF